MKNLVKKACVLASALIVGGVSNASTVYPSYGPNSYEFEYEVDYFEPSRSEVDLGTAADGLSLLLRGAQLAFDKNAHPALRTLGALVMWSGFEFGSQAMGYGSPTAKLWDATGGKLLKLIDDKHADIEIRKPNGEVGKMRVKILYNGPNPMYFPVKYDQQPQNFGLSRNDYNYYLANSSIPDDYSQILAQEPDLPTEDEIKRVQGYVKNNYEGYPSNEVPPVGYPTFD